MMARTSASVLIRADRDNWRNNDRRKNAAPTNYSKGENMNRQDQRRRLSLVVCITMLLVIFGAPSAAQVDVSAKLLGTVMDPTGAVIPQAQIVVQNEQTGLVLTAQSDERGNFIFPSLPAGTFSVSCEAAGFKKFVS